MTYRTEATKSKPKPSKRPLALWNRQGHGHQSRSVLAGARRGCRGVHREAREAMNATLLLGLHVSSVFENCLDIVFVLEQVQWSMD